MSVPQIVRTLSLALAITPSFALAASGPLSAMRCEADRVSPAAKVCLATLTCPGAPAPAPAIRLGGAGEGAMVFEMLGRSPCPFRRASGWWPRR